MTFRNTYTKPQNFSVFLLYLVFNNNFWEQSKNPKKKT